MFSNNNDGRGTYIQVPGGEYWCQVNPGTDTSRYDMNRAETYTDGTIHAPCRITENTHRTNNIANSNPLVQNPASMDLNFMRREQSLQKERDAFYARQLEKHAKFLNDAKNSFNSSIQQGAIYTPTPFKSYESWLGGDPRYYGSDFAYKNYLNEKACWDVSEKQKYNQSVSNKEGIEKQRQWVNSQIDHWDSVTDVNVLQQNLSAYDDHPSIKQFMKDKISYLENLENYVNRIRSMEEELYEKPITNSYENINKKWWVNPKNANSHFEHLNNEMSVKRRVDEARELQKELYGEYETPSYKQIALDLGRKEYWGSVKQSDSYLGKLRSDKFIKDRVDEARKLEQELYGDIQTPTWDKVTKSYWVQREQSDEYLGHLRFDKFVKDCVDKARMLETEIYGKPQTNTWGNVNKKWWGTEENSLNYLLELQNKALLKDNVNFARKLETGIFGITTTPTWDDVNKEWWDNKDNVLIYLNELNKKRLILQNEKKQLAELEQAKLIMESALEEVAKKVDGERSPRKMLKLYDAVNSKSKKLAELGDNQAAKEWENLAKQTQEKHQVINKPTLTVEVIEGKVGHARIGIYTTDGKLEYYGFGSDNQPFSSGNIVLMDDIVDNIASQYKVLQEKSALELNRKSVVKKIPLTEDQAEKLIKFIEKSKNTHSTYSNMYGYNCKSWSNDALKEIGINATVNDLFSEKDINELLGEVRGKTFRAF